MKKVVSSSVFSFLSGAALLLALSTLNLAARSAEFTRGKRTHSAHFRHRPPFHRWW